MSIKHLVKGKYTCTVKGDYTVYSNGNIVHNASKSVDQKGIDKGTSYKEPKEINPNDTPSDTIDVTLNLFFDGTQNNKTNTDSRVENNITYNSKSNKTDDSYTNDYSNIARGYDAIDATKDNQVTVYIEGIGTVDGKRDTYQRIDIPNNLGSPTGEGDRGIPAKVTKGCIIRSDAIKDKFPRKKINKLKINVFGFSRGAAAARHFIAVASTQALIVETNKTDKITIAPFSAFENSKYENDKGIYRYIDQFIEIDEEDKFNPIIEKHGYFGACLVKNEIQVEEIVFNFVGLYDTVATFGLNHRGFNIGKAKIIKTDAEQLHLDAIKKAYFTLQISSADDYRENFSLTNIKSTGIKGLEFTLPGVHSDIGGSYVDGEEENSNIHKGTKQECYKMKELLVDEGWFTNSQLEIYKITKSSLGIDYSTEYELKGKRRLSNHYDKIPLNWMFRFSKLETFGIKYDQKKIDTKESITREDIKVADNYLSFYVNNCITIRKKYADKYNKGISISEAEYIKELEELSYLDKMDDNVLKNLRGNYFHWFANVNRTGFGPEVKEPTSFDKRKRHIIPG